MTGIEAGTELFSDILSYLMSFAMAYFCFLFYAVTEWEITLIMKLVYSGSDSHVESGHIPFRQHSSA